MNINRIFIHELDTNLIMIRRYLFLIIFLLTGMVAMAQTNPTDTDGDTVLDSLDQCPDKAGCAEILGCPCVMVSDTVFLSSTTKMGYYLSPVFQTTQKSVLVEDSIPQAGRYIKLEDSVQILLYEYHIQPIVGTICPETEQVKLCYAKYCDGTKMYKYRTVVRRPSIMDASRPIVNKRPTYKVLKYTRYVKDPKGEYMNEQPAKYEQIDIKEMVKEPELAYKMVPPQFIISKYAACVQE